MIKLTQLLSELGINNPNITAEEVWHYYTYICTSISHNDFIRIVKPIVVKYGYKFPMGARDFIMSLDQQVLNKFYRELKSEFNNINELEVSNPTPTRREVYKYYTLLMWKYGDANTAIQTCWPKIRPIFNKYGYGNGTSTRDFIENLDKKTLNQFYRELKSIEKNI